MQIFTAQEDEGDQEVIPDIPELVDRQGGKDQFRYVWNDFLIPLILLRSKNLHTLPIKLQVMDSITIAKDYDAMIATGFIAIIIPIIFFLFFQKHFLEGLSGGLKE